jgi:hypothetical protein
MSRPAGVCPMYLLLRPMTSRALLLAVHGRIGGGAPAPPTLGGRRGGRAVASAIREHRESVILGGDPPNYVDEAVVTDLSTAEQRARAARRGPPKAPDTVRVDGEVYPTIGDEEQVTPTDDELAARREAWEGERRAMTDSQRAARRTLPLGEAVGGRAVQDSSDSRTSGRGRSWPRRRPRRTAPGDGARPVRATTTSPGTSRSPRQRSRRGARAGRGGGHRARPVGGSHVDGGEGPRVVPDVRRRSR